MGNYFSSPTVDPANQSNNNDEENNVKVEELVKTIADFHFDTFKDNLQTAADARKIKLIWRESTEGPNGDRTGLWAFSMSIRHQKVVGKSRMDTELKTASEILDELTKQAITAHAFTLYLRTSQDVIGRDDQILYFNVNTSSFEMNNPSETTTRDETEDRQSSEEAKQSEFKTSVVDNTVDNTAESKQEKAPQLEDFDYNQFMHDLNEVAATRHIKIYECDPDDFTMVASSFPHSVVLYDIKEGIHGATVEDVYEQMTNTSRCLTTSIDIVFEFEYLKNNTCSKVTLRYSIE